MTTLFFYSLLRLNRYGGQGYERIRNQNVRRIHYGTHERVRHD